MGDRTIELDPEALAEVARQMSLIVSALEDAGDDKDLYADDLGDEHVQDRFGAFVNGWRDGRKRIIGDCEKLGGMVSGALEAYLENETNIADGATESADGLQYDGAAAGGGS
jgi:hypothetical protein